MCMAVGDGRAASRCRRRAEAGAESASASLERRSWLPSPVGGGCCPSAPVPLIDGWKASLGRGGTRALLLLILNPNHGNLAPSLEELAPSACYLPFAAVSSRALTRQCLRGPASSPPCQLRPWLTRLCLHDHPSTRPNVGSWRYPELSAPRKHTSTATNTPAAIESASTSQAEAALTRLLCVSAPCI
ncbi:hypothetical protein BDV95DRAFT_348283 [Massariosphaeria phaeospora]|uniref:Uncharacterized protein n=1 Tax=Massariosphaeria phaeospora TaxID=100035 RepID=A0A7C8MBE9_9PLEO|nr:hypothetical protein BDV95DRAFT_348283 [Massariosphaeria phaeospora]